jgi:hypothetical protein
MISLDKIEEVLLTAKAETEKVNKGNKSARTRLRKAMQDLKTLSQDIRVQVSGLTDTL